jgi:AGCS family alanine or glycine:cation symporter
MLEKLDTLFAAFADFMWGTPLLVLLLGGGLFFTMYCRFIPFRYVRHGLNVLMGKYDDPNDPGQVNHFQALSSALASTVGMGNISGVAIAIHTGGPGALFWMWMSAIVGMATKFFTCTLAIMYRGTDEDGEVQGGPMYVITEGMSKKFHPLAYLFSFAGLLGCLSLFQANQLTQIVQDQIYIPFGYFENNPVIGQLLVGLFMAAVISAVIFGGIRRIGQVASKLVPSMVVIYMLCGVIILIRNFTMIDDIFLSIVRDAFTGEAVLGGSMGSVIVIGIRRAAFSNEAGIGTEAMAHGAAITKEPVREGLVAMLGPMIDTLIVCSVTGFVILSTGVWMNPDLNGISMTTQAFEVGLPIIGKPLLILIVIVFSLTTMIGYSYYGSKCTAFLFGNKWKQSYRIFYTLSLILASVITIDLVINFIDGMFALMAIPTMVSSIILAPKVMRAAREYFNKLAKPG